MDERLEDLLLAWQEARERGEDLAAGELCRTCPEQTETLARHIDFLRRMDALMQTDDAAPPTLPEGREAVQPLPASVAGYEILAELGRGGMGVVYQARQQSPNRLVALKMILAGAHAGVGATARFLNEAETIAKLTHPNIVQLYAVGTHEGKPYFSLEYVAGGTLAAALQGKAQAPAPTAHLIQTLALAVQFAHEQGIIHRDLKPANILLAGGGVVSVEGAAQHDRTGSPLTTHHSPLTTPKIADFGLARQGEPLMTASGEMLGTPSYMAPEQAAGGARTVGPAADIYALGAILYEMLTGQPPFHGASAWDTIERVIRTDPTAPSQLQPGVPRDLETICLKCLSKEPGRRYGSAGALADDLQRFLTGEPIHARPVGRMERLWKRVRRQPVAAALLGSTLLALLGLLAGGLWHAHVLSQEDAVRERLRADAETRIEAERQAVRDSEELRRRRLVYARTLPDAQHILEAGDALRARNLLDDLRPPPGQPDLRGFEWHYVWQRCHDSDFVFPGNEKGVTAVAFAPDGRTLAWVGGDDVVRLLDPRSGRLQASFHAHRAHIRRIAFAPCGSVLATASDDRTVKLWDRANGQLRATLIGHDAEVVCLAFSPDGGTLASGSDDNTIILWDPGTQRMRARCRGHGDHVLTLAFAPHQPTLVSAALGDKPHLWNTTTGTLQGTIADSGRAVNSLAFTPDGRLLAAGEVDANRVRLWHTATWQECATLPGPGGQIFRVVLSPDGQTLAVNSVADTAPDSVVCLWDMASRQPWSTLQQKREIWDLAFAPDGARLALAGADGTVRLWHPTRPGAGPSTPTHFPAEAWGVAFAPDGKTLVSVGDRLLGLADSVKLWDAATGKCLWSTSGHESLVSCVAFSPDGKHIASGGYDKTVRLWDPASGRERLVLRDHTGDLRSVAFSPDSRLLASAGKDWLVQLHDVGTGQLVHKLTGHQDQVRSLAFAPDGRRLLTASGDKTLRLWDVTTGEQLRVFQDTAGVYAVAFAPDGRSAFSGNHNGQVTAWDLEYGQERRLHGQHQKAVWAIAFTPDGRTVASAGLDHLIRLWDPVTGYELMILRGHEQQINALAFSAGDVLASASHDGTVRLWRAPVTNLP